MAIDLIVQHIRSKLGQNDLRRIYPNLAGGVMRTSTTTDVEATNRAHASVRAFILMVMRTSTRPIESLERVRVRVSVCAFMLMVSHAPMSGQALGQC